LPWEWRKHPVIKLDLNVGSYAGGVAKTRSSLKSRLLGQATELGIVLPDMDFPNQFEYLLVSACEKAGERAGVVIDEYDKPMLDTIHNRKMCTQVRTCLRDFYGVLKSCTDYLRFVFITGITKFSHVNIFSGLNHLTDLSFDDDFAEVCGFSQAEVERDFAPEIESVCRFRGIHKAEYLEQLRAFYNGYRFSEKPTTVYNPFGLLHHFRTLGKFKGYWYSTSTPTFLVKLLADGRLSSIDNQRKSARETDFGTFEIDNIAPLPLLYQTGYLTITDYDTDSQRYTLDFPNGEVRSSFYESLLTHHLGSVGEAVDRIDKALFKALMAGNIEAAMEALEEFIESIPYDITIKSERYYHTLVHLIFALLGLRTRSEVRTARGRIDTLVETEKYVYLFEFKIDKSADEALEQINSRRYSLPWRGTGKKLFKVGVNINTKDRNIDGWKFETVEPVTR
jgi:hypothetical protein